MRLLLLLFVVLFAKTESLSLGSFFNGLLGFSDDSQIIGIPSKSEGFLNETNEIFLNDTLKGIDANDSAVLSPNQNPEEYEYQDIEATTVSLEEDTSELSTVITEGVVTEAVTTEITTENDSESTKIPQTELGDFVEINSDNFIDEGSGEDIPKDLEAPQDFSTSSSTLIPSTSTLEEILTGTPQSIWETTTISPSNNKKVLPLNMYQKAVNRFPTYRSNDQN